MQSRLTVRAVWILDAGAGARWRGRARLRGGGAGPGRAQGRRGCAGAGGGSDRRRRPDGRAEQRCGRGPRWRGRGPLLWRTVPGWAVARRRRRVIWRGGGRGRVVGWGRAVDRHCSSASGSDVYGPCCCRELCGVPQPCVCTGEPCLHAPAPGMCLQGQAQGTGRQAPASPAVNGPASMPATPTASSRSAATCSAAGGRRHSGPAHTVVWGRCHHPVTKMMVHKWLHRHSPMRCL